jgi:hypothetical protein
MPVRSPCKDNVQKFAFLVPGGKQGVIRYAKGKTVQEAAELVHQLFKAPWCIPLDFDTHKPNGPKIEFT